MTLDGDAFIEGDCDSSVALGDLLDRRTVATFGVPFSMERPRCCDLLRRGRAGSGGKIVEVPGVVAACTVTVIKIRALAPDVGFVQILISFGIAFLRSVPRDRIDDAVGGFVAHWLGEGAINQKEL